MKRDSLTIKANLSKGKDAKLKGPLNKFKGSLATEKTTDDRVYCGLIQ